MIQRVFCLLLIASLLLNQGLVVACAYHGSQHASSDQEFHPHFHLGEHEHNHDHEHGHSHDTGNKNRQIPNLQSPEHHDFDAIFMNGSFDLARENRLVKQIDLLSLIAVMDAKFLACAHILNGRPTSCPSSSPLESELPVYMRTLSLRL